MEFEIPLRAFSKRRISTALRALLMAACSAICWVLTYSYTYLPIAVWGFGLLTTALVCAAIWLASRKIPDNRKVVLASSIKIPAPLIFKGLDTTREPINFWMHQDKIGEEIVFTTRSRLGSIQRSWFTEQQWQRLIENLPEIEPLTEGSKKEGLRLCFAALLLICVGLHWYTNQVDIDATARRLLLGAYNPALALDGEIYRSLSYAFLHISDMHLIVNGFVLFLLSSALRRSYSNFSLIALMGSTAILSVVIGTQLSTFEIAVGASGIVMGVAGFLVTAQYNNDARLHPIHRVTQHRYLALYLIFEVVISLTFKSYGGMVHIAGFMLGSGYYLFFEKQNLTETARTQRKRFQWAIHLILISLTLQWVSSTYLSLRSPYKFVQRITNHNDAVLMAVGALATPDNPRATENAVENARTNALANIENFDYSAIAVARADFWLGNNEAALTRIRQLSIEQPDNQRAISLWLAIEHASLDNDRELLPDNKLPPGRGGAYIVSERGDYLARFKLRAKPQDLTRKIKRPAYRNWRLVAVTEELPLDAEGIWRLGPNQFRTRNSAASTNP